MDNDLRRKKHLANQEHKGLFQKTTKHFALRVEVSLLHGF